MKQINFSFLPGLFLVSIKLITNFSAQANSFQVNNSLPVDLQSASSVFSKSVEVFGIRILATSGVSNEKVLHTANVLAEYLDNDENGMIDQPEVLAKLLGDSNSQISTMVLFSTENEQENSNLTNLENIITRSQNLFSTEIFENGSNGNDRDATLEEVLHLITDKGWDEAFPNIWGEKRGSSIANAMDIARGGYFETVPSSYPASAWFTYDDQTADYGTQITEYVYWATTTYLGGQNWPGRIHSNYNSEWKPITQADLNSTDPTVVSILTSPNYTFPIVQIPDGNYSGSGLRAQASMTSTTNWKNSSWLGYFYDPGNNWIFQQDLGWLYTIESNYGGLWMYHSNYGWMWTNSTVFPWIYFDSFSDWRYFKSEYGFHNYVTQEWSSTTSLLAQITNILLPISKIVLSPNDISYYEANSSATNGWVRVAQETSSSLSSPLVYLQGNSAFERKSRPLVFNYRTQVANGGPLTLSINGQSTINSLTIEHDSTNDEMIVTGNGVPNYQPSILGIEVTNGWNSVANAGFESLKLSENNLGSMGGNNPNQIIEATEIFRIPLTPVYNSTTTDTSLGTVGVALNGIPVYNPFENAQETSAYGRIFSNCCGHPQHNGVYHYHKYPTCLRLISNNWKTEKEKCDELDALLTTAGHSPLIGFAIDGWPIYGPVGWKSQSNRTGVLLKSSYTGNEDSAGNPSYVQGSGDLDECNGINSPTPEFPEGIYHYVMSVEADTDGTVLRYQNPHFGYDVRNTLKKHSVMPATWTDDTSYLSDLKSGFSINGIALSGTDSFSTFVEFITNMKNALNSNGMSTIGNEFETMKIDYPFTIRKYRGIPTTNSSGKPGKND